MRNPFVKKSPATERDRVMRKHVEDALDGELNGAIIGFTIEDGSEKVHSLLAMNGEPMMVGHMLANTRARLMKHKEFGSILSAAVSAALWQVHPESMKDPIDLLLEKMGEHDC